MDSRRVNSRGQTEVRKNNRDCNNMTKTQNKKRPNKIGKKGAAKESKLFLARREAQVIVSNLPYCRRD